MDEDIWVALYSGLLAAENTDYTHPATERAREWLMKNVWED